MRDEIIIPPAIEDDADWLLHDWVTPLLPKGVDIQDLTKWERQQVRSHASHADSCARDAIERLAGIIEQVAVSSSSFSRLAANNALGRASDAVYEVGQLAACLDGIKHRLATQDRDATQDHDDDGQ